MKASSRIATPQDWTEAAARLDRGDVEFVSLWGDEGCVCLALRAPGAAELEILRLPLEAGAFPSLARVFEPAVRLERALVDLYGHVATGADDGRRWLDHGRWPLRAPLGAASAHEGPPDVYAFRSAQGHGLHQIPVGPVHAGIIEPGHFRFHASGEAVVRLEERLGYVHKGVDALMRGASLDSAAVLAGRISGDSTVAYAFAFARAVESALGVVAPPRAQYLRGIMAELERLANHLGDIGAICNDASFALMQAHSSALRERILRAGEAAFGHRLMMDAIAPGGVARDLAPAGAEAIRACVADVGEALPRLITLYDNTASLQDRTVGTGRLSPALARRFCAGGFVGRASGRDFDARRDHAYAPYDVLVPDVPVLAAGDVNARVWLRIREAEASLSLIPRLLDALPDGAIRVALPTGVAGEGFARIEGFRGDVFAAVRLDAMGAVARAHLRDPSWLQWPLLEAAIEGNIVADFPLCNKSFNCSYSGVDI